MNEFGLDAKRLVDGLIEFHAPHKHRGEWAILKELRLGTGFGHDVEQRIDVWAMNLWPSLGFEKVAYEIKVDRRDLLHELKHPEKRQAALAISDRFYFATPFAMVNAGELPREAGLVELHERTGRIQIIKQAPLRPVTDLPSWALVASLLRRSLGHEAAATERLRSRRQSSAAGPKPPAAG